LNGKFRLLRSISFRRLLVAGTKSQQNEPNSIIISTSSITEYLHITRNQSKHNAVNRSS